MDATLQTYGLAIIVANIAAVIVVYVAANAKAREFALMAIAMAYRMTMTQLVDKVKAMTPEERKAFAGAAYDKLPSAIYGFPLKTFVSRDAFAALCDQLLMEMLASYPTTKRAVAGAAVDW